MAIRARRSVNVPVRVLIALAALFVGCTSGDSRGRTSASASAARATDLTGAGATFPYPIYSRWFADYAVQTGVRINYQSIGSGGGVRQLFERTVDFGASEAVVSDSDIAAAHVAPLLQLPVVLGAVAVIYNVPELRVPLRISGAVLADIYLGRVTTWNAVALRDLNPGVVLPPQDIIVTYRADASGSTYVLSEFLAQQSPAWQAGPGVGKALRWPVGLGAKGNEGVSGQVKLTPYTIGFAEVAFARQNGLAIARVRNAAGAFVAPTVAAIRAAATGVEARLPGVEDFRVSLVDAPGRDAYPVSSFTWILFYRQQADAAKGRALVDFLRWAIHAGQSNAEPLDYAPLPAALVTRVEHALDRVTFGPVR